MPEPSALHPRRIVLILPCCIGDVVLATATLHALRRGFPDAHITWAVSRWARAAVEGHPLLDALLDAGPSALPVRSPDGLLRFAGQLRAGRFDLAVSLVRSPLMSVALLLSGIPRRAGLDSAGRGFGYNIRARIDPNVVRHEAEIYLDVPRALGLDSSDCWASVPVPPDALESVRALLAGEGMTGPYLVLNPAGGRNPGMTMDAKRWPVENFAALGDRLAARLSAQIVLLGGPDDTALVEGVREKLRTPALSLAGRLSFPQIGALARGALLYVGNDTGVTHYAAAAGARAAMIFGPSDPARYAPFTPGALALWKPAAVPAGGVAAGAPPDWDWQRDGISVEEVERRLLAFLGNEARAGG